MWQYYLCYYDWVLGLVFFQVNGHANYDTAPHNSQLQVVHFIDSVKLSLYTWNRVDPDLQ